MGTTDPDAIATAITTGVTDDFDLQPRAGRVRIVTLWKSTPI
jgi:hypothetical protein